MTDEELIEELAGAWREPAETLRFHPAWHDLGPEARREAHRRATELRRLEAAAHPEGHSGTTAAVLARIRAARPE